MSDDPFPGSSADFYEQIQVLKDRVEAGRVELHQQWERMQTENLAAKHLLAAKDAEIERLNKACETLRVSHRNGLALITELRDALVFYAPFSSEPHYRDLIQRAREATR